MLGIKRVKHFESFYNIASRAAQSNSVYVSVLKIPMVHADSVSKSLGQNFFFFARAAIVSAGKNNIFRDSNGYKQRLGPPAPKRRQFSELFPWTRVLKWGRKREKQRKRRLHEQSLLILLSVFCVGFDAQFHRLLYKTMSYKTQEARVALGYCLGQLLRFFRALQTSHVFHNSIVHAKAWTNC